MSSKMKSEEILSDDEGVSLGSVGGYVKRFKDQEKQAGTANNFNPKKSFSMHEEPEIASGKPHKKLAKPADPNQLPAVMDSSNEKSIYVYYYSKFGNLECDDFDKVKGKIASAINRLFSKKLEPVDALVKLEQHVSLEDIEPLLAEEESSPSQVTASVSVKKIAPSESVKVDLVETAYSFVKGLSPLTREQLDLVRFVDVRALCFSSDGSNFYLAVLPTMSDCFEKLFKFTPKEELVYSMFKEQLGDEHKAKKLVLMSRLLNDVSSDDVISTPEPITIPPKTTSRKRPVSLGPNGIK